MIFTFTSELDLVKTIFIKTKVNNLQLIYKWFGLGLNQYSGKKYTGDILDKELFWDGYHPSESAHLKWARILYKDLKDKL